MPDVSGCLKALNVAFFAPGDYRFPSPLPLHRDGFVGVSRDLDAPRLLAAYRLGIFPWYEKEGLFYWFATAPRTVLFPAKLHAPRSLQKLLRHQVYRVSINEAFAKVMAACATIERAQSGTWISPAFQAAYGRLHDMGHAHSFECWLPGDTGEYLAGGFYGVQIGAVFYGESMFARAPNASKIAFAKAVPWLHAAGIQLIDCQQNTAHMARFGSEMLPFARFQAALKQLNAESVTLQQGVIWPKKVDSGEDSPA